MNFDPKTKCAPTPMPESAVPPEGKVALMLLARIILATYQHPRRLPESAGTVSLCTPEK